jgi:hypothetical protein
MNQRFPKQVGRWRRRAVPWHARDPVINGLSVAHGCAATYGLAGVRDMR